MDDMLEQMKAVKKMGGMKGILGMLPGGQRALNQMGGNLDEKIFDRNEAIILSMTAEERRRPSIINGQRRARIARGCGLTPTCLLYTSRRLPCARAEGVAWGRMSTICARSALRRPIGRELFLSLIHI